MFRSSLSRIRGTLPSSYLHQLHFFAPEQIHSLRHGWSKQGYRLPSVMPYSCRSRNETIGATSPVSLHHTPSTDICFFKPGGFCGYDGKTAQQSVKT